MEKTNFNNLLMFCLTLIIIAYTSIMRIEYKASEKINYYENVITRMQNDSALRSQQIKIQELQEFQDSVMLYQLNWSNIDHWLDQFGIEHKEIVKHQIFLESANLTSVICNDNNNIFGMRRARVRKTTAIGDNRGFAVYDTFVSSIMDYALWQASMYDGSNDYYAFLDRVGYCVGDSYISRLKYIDRNKLI